jgi:dienelactone hydrolase
VNKVFRQYTSRFTKSCAIASTAFVATVSSSQQFVTFPANEVLMNDPVGISLRGLQPKQTVKVTAERVVFEFQTQQRVLYRSHAVYEANDQGTVEVTAATPKSGTYKRADARGLFWSMVPTKDAVGERQPLRVDFTATAIDKDGKESADKPLATTSLRILNQRADVKIETVDAFPGAQFANSTESGKRPAIILLGGSEGGSFIARDAPMLASRGFAVLAFPYYSPPVWPSQKAELPELPAAFADIPIERLNLAREWLQKRADVDSERIAIFGTSKGAEFVLLAGVHLPWVTSVVAYTPSDVVWEGWGPNIEPGKRASFALNGKPFPFVPYEGFGSEFAGFQTNEPVRIRRPQDKGRAANPLAAVKARIPVEKIKAPVLVVAGQDDQLWNAAMMAHNIAERRAEANLDTVSLIYVDAGHFLNGSAMNPTTQYDAGLNKVGGTPEGNAFAQSDAFPKVIAFLKRTLAAPAK